MQEGNEKTRIMAQREIMKTAAYESQSDQQLGLPQPPLEKQCGTGRIIPLTRDFTNVMKKPNYAELLDSRISRRKYCDIALTLDELAFLLWATQGVKEVIGKVRKAAMRTVPSAGARHPFETYLFVNRVDGLEQGLYHYLSMEHKLEFIKQIDNQTDQVSAAFFGQTFFGYAPVGFVWTVIPYRTEWRYTINAQKYALIDAGHVCQSLYLACEAIDCGTCAIGAYDQKMADELLGLDSSPSSDNENEFVVYAAAVGRAEHE